MTEPTLRPATPADAPAMQACVDAAYCHYIPRLDGQKPGPMERDYAQEVRDHIAYILEDNGEVIGILVLIRKDDGILLDNVAVHPAYQKQGYGRRLLQFAETTARDLGFEVLTLYTNAVMTENQALYKRIGYVETRRVEEHGFTRV